MCLVSSRNCITDKEMIVYKVQVAPRLSERYRGVFVSPVTEYLPIYGEKSVAPDYPLEDDLDSGILSTGFFHFYIDIDVAAEFAQNLSSSSTLSRVIKCIVPKSSRVYFDRFDERGCTKILTHTKETVVTYPHGVNLELHPTIQEGD
jgi:hypothetical protein